jgi:uncharacterized protein (DUF1330 family)
MNRIETLAPGEVFVFGSNASGAHGGGAALFAYERFGAVWGQGEGLQGQSYGIDTMSGRIVFEQQAARFLAFARAHAELRFLVTEVGCGIAGYTPEEVAPFFAAAPENVVLPDTFVALLPGSPQGTDAALILCVLLWARDGEDGALHDYEDRVLTLIPEHGGEVLSRVTMPASDELPCEVQVIRFPGSSAMDAYLADERRMALSPLRDQSVARTETRPATLVRGV